MQQIRKDEQNEYNDRLEDTKRKKHALQNQYYEKKTEFDQEKLDLIHA